ncbi:MAG: hypothetical protein ACQESR_00335 [Planctomycetota bacterium]
MESRPTQAVLPLVGLAAEEVIRDRHKRMYHEVASLGQWLAARRAAITRQL